MLCSSEGYPTELCLALRPAAGEEEEADDYALGSVEQAPAALRAPSASVCAAFVSDRQKHETAPADSPLTKIVLGALWLLHRVQLAGCCSCLLASLQGSPFHRRVAAVGGTWSSCCCQAHPRCSPCIFADRTAHLRPGSQFIKSFWMTEGVRCTNTSVVRCAACAQVGGDDWWSTSPACMCETLKRTPSPLLTSAAAAHVPRLPQERGAQGEQAAREHQVLRVSAVGQAAERGGCQQRS